MITDQALQLLKGGKALTTPELVDHIPELAGQSEGHEVLRLLLRLDRRFTFHEGHWIARVEVIDSEQQILSAVQDYFKKHPHGEILEHLVRAVSTQTNRPTSEIENIILKTYRSVGRMILNQLKEKY